MRIGICGGTFDPFHRGHLDPVLAVRAGLGWNRILYIPAFVNPFKQERDTASGYHRFAMAILATERHDDVFVSPQELERAAISYTVDTLQQLRSEYPGATLDWVIGDDNIEGLLAWKSIDTIFDLANFVVLTRGGGGQAIPPVLSSRVRDLATRPTHGAVVFAENATVPVSSTEIRMRIRAGQPIDHLVDARVSHYIHHYGLYRKGQS
jgi:nicotinate-nucleotide adenylyltransferase